MIMTKYRREVARFRQGLILAALERNGWIPSQAAKDLGVTKQFVNHVLREKAVPSDNQPAKNRLGNTGWDGDDSVAQRA